MIISFYSYKGGVGRSLALANVAWAYYRAGLRVLCIDGDLEAPGLEMIFKAAGLPVSEQHLGYVDLLHNFSELVRSGVELSQSGFSADQAVSSSTADMSSFGWGQCAPPLNEYIQEINSDSGQPNQLLFLGAGDRTEFQSYLDKMRKFSWGDLGGESAESAFYAWFRTALSNIADVVLFDSRTGFSEIYGIATKHIADMVVVLFAPNKQNYQGTIAMLNDLAKSPRFPWLSQTALPTLLVPSRVDQGATQMASADFIERIVSELEITENIDLQSAKLLIPYVRRFAIDENMAFREYEKREELTYSHNIRSPQTIESRQVEEMCEAYFALASEIASLSCKPKRSIIREQPAIEGFSKEQTDSANLEAPERPQSRPEIEGLEISSKRKKSVIISSVLDDVDAADYLGRYLQCNGYDAIWTSELARSVSGENAENIFLATKSIFESVDVAISLESRFSDLPYRWSLRKWWRSTQLSLDSNENEFVDGDSRDLSSNQLTTDLKWFDGSTRISRGGPRTDSDITEYKFGKLIFGLGEQEWWRWSAAIKNKIDSELRERSQKDASVTIQNGFSDFIAFFRAKPAQTFLPMEVIDRCNSLRDDNAILAEYEPVRDALDWPNTTGSARKWWEAFENENKHRRGLVLRLALELLWRKATITEFFLAYVYSNTDNIQANLHYLDFSRLKKEEERKRQLAKAQEVPTSQDDDSNGSNGDSPDDSVEKSST